MILSFVCFRLALGRRWGFYAHCRSSWFSLLAWSCVAALFRFPPPLSPPLPSFLGLRPDATFRQCTRATSLHTSIRAVAMGEKGSWVRRREASDGFAFLLVARIPSFVSASPRSCMPSTVPPGALSTSPRLASPPPASTPLFPPRAPYGIRAHRPSRSVESRARSACARLARRRKQRSLVLLAR